MELISKIALGGGCHWCTEAVFQSLLGVEKVEQGYIASVDENSNFSEAVIIHFNSELISLETLIEIHLYTHKSTSNHSMRTKYRSAIYVFSGLQKLQSETIIKNFKKDFDNKLITQIYPFHSFKASRESIQNYYQKNPEKPFCKTFINPKLKLLLNQFSKHTNIEELKHLV
ncbi:peptide-methionine (S)-S-oxide reductase [Mariniflexile litorale]|uniref:peptide-methionine (S)-S-oxide reductase n=1 Tax=Mariniflexile litorale TaxID=3045158 RepID=A0AAU7EAK1_9FLAO|nr:peptide-methionine (S)-S-oxide reductase [Mariniflexile sp. KMM 9835]MDQ8210521.1 peptide-methionine (S)-S-oxide reductase [Mariniflexile sp. KMM 9835]